MRRSVYTYICKSNCTNCVVMNRDMLVREVLNEGKWMFMRLCIVIIIKTSSTGPSGNKKVVYKFATPQAPAPRKTEENTTEGRTIDCILETIQRSGVKHSVGKVITHSNLSRQERPSKLGHFTPWYFKLKKEKDWIIRAHSNSNRRAVAAARVCRTLVEADGS